MGVREVVIKIIKRLVYFSPLGLVIGVFQNVFSVFTRPFMVYGYWNAPTRCFRRFTRISSTAVLSDKNKIDIADNCWIWHHSILDGSNGIVIEEGVQIGAWVGVFTHGSHIAVRLHGKNYMHVDKNERIGYTRAPVRIGAYSFIGAGACILPGVEIGKGVLVAAGAIVNKNLPDFSIAQGNPAKIIGSTLDYDSKFFDLLDVQRDYFDREKIKEYLSNRAE